MSILNEEMVRNLTKNSGVPLVFRGFVKKWTYCDWPVEKWCSVFGDKEIPFRCMARDFISEEPCWERRCQERRMSFKSFVDLASSDGQEWMYFDYKYLHQWFSSDTELCQGLMWKQFGYPEKGAADTTLWVGSHGAHTPAHQDTYGVNIVAQVHGKKRWILFPPETGGLRPSRVPYEESSVYSELNFYCPTNFNCFNGLTGGRAVQLAAGDALLVPRGWWHYVQNVDPLNITFNVWLPHEKDKTTQVSEALIKILVAQICKDLPQDTAKLIVNPNEDDLTETPLAVLFLQLEAVAKSYLDSRRKARRAKRQRTREDDPAAAEPEREDFDLKALLENNDNKLELAKNITSDELISMLKENIKEFTNTEKGEEDEADGGPASLRLTKAVIDAFSQSSVIELVKQNLFARLS